MPVARSHHLNLAAETTALLPWQITCPTPDSVVFERSVGTGGHLFGEIIVVYYMVNGTVHLAKRTRRFGGRDTVHSIQATDKDKREAVDHWLTNHQFAHRAIVAHHLLRTNEHSLPAAAYQTALSMHTADVNQRAHDIINGTTADHTTHTGDAVRALNHAWLDHTIQLLLTEYADTLDAATMDHYTDNGLDAYRRTIGTAMGRLSGADDDQQPPANLVAALEGFRTVILAEQANRRPARKTR